MKEIHKWTTSAAVPPSSARKGFAPGGAVSDIIGNTEFYLKFGTFCTTLKCCPTKSFRLLNGMKYQGN